MAPIAVGETIPDGTLHWFDENGELQQLSVHSLAAGKKIVFIGVPGAFTPTCSMQHVPGFITNTEELKSKGVDEILVISDFDVRRRWVADEEPVAGGGQRRQAVGGGGRRPPHHFTLAGVFGIRPNQTNFKYAENVNDPFVMKAWAKSYPENKEVKFLADGSANYIKALGLELDLSEKGLGLRSRRYAILVEDLKVKVANIEEGGAFTISGVDEILKSL